MFFSVIGFMFFTMSARVFVRAKLPELNKCN